MITDPEIQPKKKSFPLHIRIIFGLIAGVVWALIATTWGFQPFTIDWIDPFGKIFIRLLKLIAVPLVLFSIIKGVSGLPDVKSLGRMGIKTLLLYLLTTVSAVSLGLGMVNLIKPGKMADDSSRLSNRINYEVYAEKNGLKPKDGRCFSCDPKNFALKKKAEDILANEPIDEKVQSKIKEAGNLKQTGPLQPLVDLVPENIFFSLNNMGLMLQVIFFAIFFGIVYLFLPILINDAAGVIDEIPQFLNSLVEPVTISDTLSGTESSTKPGLKVPLQNIIQEFQAAFANASQGFVTTLSLVFGGLISFILIIVSSLSSAL